MNHFTFLLNTIVLVGCLVFAGTIAWWVIDNDPPVKIIHAEAVNPVVAPGELLRIRYYVDRKRICHVRLQQVVVDYEGYRQEPDDRDYVLDPGELGKTFFTIGVRLSHDVAEGEATYQAFRSYQCNPIHNWFFRPIPLVSPKVRFMVKR